MRWGMAPISYARRRSPPDVMRQAVRLYPRFTLSYRDVEAIRQWVLKFGLQFARNLLAVLR
jgi:putative transposase